MSHELLDMYIYALDHRVMIRHPEFLLPLYTELYAEPRSIQGKDFSGPFTSSVGMCVGSVLPVSAQSSYAAHCGPIDVQCKASTKVAHLYALISML